MPLLKPSKSVRLSAGETLPATFRFKTREGGLGILQITGFTDRPPGVRIRYKLVQKGESLPVIARMGVKAGKVVILTPPNEASITLPCRFSWQPIDGARLYAVSISEIRGKKPVFVKETTEAEIRIEPSELKPGRNYYWHVEAIDATGRKAATTEGPCGTVINCFAVANDQEEPTRHNGKRVLLDFSHRESDIRGLGVYNFSQYTAYKLLQGEGYEVAINADRRLLHDYLKDYDLLILHSKYAGPILPFIPSEIAGIRDFVSEGGKLFVACWGSGGNADEPDLYNPLLKAFGLEVGNIDKPDFHEATLTTDDSSEGPMRIFLQCPAEIVGSNYTVLAAAPSGKTVIVKKNIGKGVVVVSGAGMAFEDSCLAGDGERAADNQKAFVAMINKFLLAPVPDATTSAPEPHPTHGTSFVVDARLAESGEDTNVLAEARRRVAQPHRKPGLQRH